VLAGREECKSEQVRVKPRVLQKEYRRPNMERENKMMELTEEIVYVGKIINENEKIDTDIKNNM